MRSMPSRVALITRALPVLGAVGVFGVLFGAAARPVLGVPLTIASSLLVFSGALQFAMVGLVAVGAGAPALLVTAASLNMRHVVMGAVLRPRLGGSRLRRALLAWFLIDESFGFAIADRDHPDRTLLVTGIGLGLAWLAGTVAGVLGAGLAAVAGLAAAIFPVLFIGLAAVAATTRPMVLRCVAAAVLTLAIAVAWPAARSVAPVVAAFLVALPRDPVRRHPAAKGTANGAASEEALEEVAE
jgi:predicted branched-subunit amino acid permease